MYKLLKVIIQQEIYNNACAQELPGGKSMRCWSVLLTRGISHKLEKKAAWIELHPLCSLHHSAVYNQIDYFSSENIWTWYVVIYLWEKQTYIKIYFYSFAYSSPPIV